MYTIIITIILVWIGMCYLVYLESDDFKLFLGDIILYFIMAIPFGLFIGIGIAKGFIPPVTINKVFTYNLGPIDKCDTTKYIGIGKKQVIMSIKGKVLIADMDRVEIRKCDSLHKVDIVIKDIADDFRNNFTDIYFHENESYIITVPDSTIKKNYFED